MKIKFYITKLLILTAVIFEFCNLNSVKTSAEEILFTSFKNTMTGCDSIQVNKKGWVQEVNTNGTLVWCYYNFDGSKYKGLLNDDGKYYYFNNNGELISNSYELK